MSKRMFKFSNLPLYYQGSPHQVEALNYLEKLKEIPEAATIIQRATEIWSDGVTPSKTKPKVRAIFTMKLERSNRIIKGQLRIVDENDRDLIVVDGKPTPVACSSGVIGYQTADHQWTRMRGPIPARKYTISTQRHWSDQSGIDGWWFDIYPIEITGPNGQRRGVFGLHGDFAMNGTNGCIGVFDRDTFNTVVVPLMVDLSEQGITEIPLEVIYPSTQTSSGWTPPYRLTPVRTKWLNAIAVCEGTADQPDNGYRTMYTHKQFTSYKQHPRILQHGNGINSDAAGRYQFMSYTWEEVQAQIKAPDFSPNSQDQGALFLIDRRGVLDELDRGLIYPVLDQLSWEWASFPASNGIGRYEDMGQKPKPLAFVLDLLK